MSEHYQDAIDVLENSQVIYEANQVTEAYDRMAQSINALVVEPDPVIICVMMGGLVTTAEVTRRLDFSFELDFLQASRYRGDTKGGELIWTVSPSIILEGRSVLIVDDILDEGHTLKAIIDCLTLQRPNVIRTAVLVEKQHDRRDSSLSADVTGLKVEDQYIFGCGMDYRGYHRQRPDIRALNV